jgi:glyoxylase-like metal-dependent hydrolase (beta-lactamase superfamily II)
VLSDNGLTLKYILLTHGHFDHILAVPALKAATGAQVVIHGEDAHCLTDTRRSLGAYRGGQKPVPADIQASNGSEFSIGSLRLTFVHTPGHTPGSCVILCGDLIFAGDTLFKGDCGRCDLPGGDYTAMLRSLKRLSQLDGDYTVYPGHGDFTTLSAERESNAYMLEAREQ